MESELIIDGQAVPLSENQEAVEEVITEQGSPENKDQETPSAVVDAENEQAEEQPEGYSLRIGDEEISLGEDADDHIDGQPAPNWVKELRKNFKEQQRENRELKRQLEQNQSGQPQQAQAEVLPEKPTLDACDWDEERYERELTEWHEKKVRAEQDKQAKDRQQQEYQQRFQQRVDAHRERASKLPVKDYQEMEEIVRAEVPDLHKEILIHAADDGSELIAYALGKNQQLRQRVSAETDPIRAAFLLGQISKQVSLAPKPKSATKPEPVVKGGGANAKQDDFNKLCPGAKIE